VNYLAGALALIALGLSLALWQQHSSLEQCNSDFTAYKAAQQQAVKDQGDKVKEAQRLQKAAEAAAKVAHDKGVQDTQPIVDDLNRRLRALTAAVHSGSVRAPVADLHGLQGGSANSGQAGSDESSLDRLRESASAAEAACLRTYADWQAILAVEPKP